MSYLVVVPELVAAAATDLANIGSSISAANAAAAAPTTALVAAGGDEVSAAIAALFGAHARAYQALSAQAAMFHEQFVRALAAGGNSYAVAEAATAQSVQQDLLNLINAPTQALLGRPLIGNGANGAGVARPSPPALWWVVTAASVVWVAPAVPGVCCTAQGGPAAMADRVVTVVLARRWALPAPAVSAVWGASPSCLARVAWVVAAVV